MQYILLKCFLGYPLKLKVFFKIEIKRREDFFISFDKEIEMGVLKGTVTFNLLLKTFKYIQFLPYNGYVCNIATIYF